MRPFRRQPRPGTRAPERSGGPSRLRNGWKRFRRATDRYRLLRDVIGALIIVIVVLGTTTVLTGGKWPPIVVVESGSMMHPVTETPYGRFGTIDVGDIVVLRDVDDHRTIRTWAEGGKEHYGRPGDVIAYAANGNRANTSTPIIIHRAMAWVGVELDPNTLRTTYRLHWVDGQVLTFGDQGIYFPPLGFDEEFGFTAARGYKPTHPGFITKGDNPFTNPAADQALGLSEVVDPSWVEGTIHGELPWMGLAKLALQTQRTNPSVPGWERIGNAFAPIELWTMFFLVSALVVLVPFTLDTWRALRRNRERREFERRSREDAAVLKRERKAQKAPRPAQPQKAPPPQPPPQTPPAPRRDPVAFVPLSPAEAQAARSARRPPPS